MKTITIKKDGNLGACSECGDTTTKVVAGAASLGRFR
jgi:hypothetical protein